MGCDINKISPAVESLLSARIKEAQHIQYIRFQIGLSRYHTFNKTTLPLSHTQQGHYICSNLRNITNAHDIVYF